MIGQTISHYDITEKLGEGGMGVVYKARDTKLDREVALKFLPESLTPTEEDRRRFIREAKSAAALNHPNICTIYSVDEHEGRQFITMEYIEGETLRDKMDRGDLPVQTALNYGSKIAEALAAAHEKGIIHRDIKPANIMVDSKGRIKVMDFGLAKLKQGRDITKTGDTVGTLAYSSPEQIRGEEVDHRSDLFSLGIVFYEMLAGQKPFRGEHQAAMTYAIVNEDPASIKNFVPEAPDKLERFFRKALAKDPQERFGSAGEMKEALEALKDEVNETNSRPKHDEADFNERHSHGESDQTITDRSIAVLPFSAFGQKEASLFTEGIHDDLLTRLSNVGELRVISRASVEKYRDSELSPPAIADSLGVRWIVDGRVQEAGGQVQVYAQLIDPQTDINRWADSYQRELTAENLFAIQGEIAKEIARAMQAELSEGEQSRIARAPTKNLESYRLYVKGRQQLAGRTFGLRVGWRISKKHAEQKLSNDQDTGLEPGKHIQRAAEFFRQAIERDSSFALAWAGLADAAAWYRSEVPDSAATLGVSQEAAARQSLKLDPDLAEAHASIGFFHLANMDAPAALEALKRALELKPSYWEAHHWLGELYLKIGRDQQALDHLNLAVELNPQHALARHWLYDAYLAAGQLENSLREARQQHKLGLEQVNAIAGQVRALYHLGRLDEAQRLAREEISKMDREGVSKLGKGLWPVAMRGHLAAVIAAQGDTAGAREQLNWIRTKETEPFWVGFVHAVVGEKNEAFKVWEGMDMEAWGRIPAPHHLRYGVLLDLTRLREDSRYRKLIQKANRAWGLNPDGSFPEKKKSVENL